MYVVRIVAFLISVACLAAAEDLLPSIFKYKKDCPKQGLCPYVKRLIPKISEHSLYYQHQGDSNHPPSLCGNLCTSDFGCPAHLKCCPTNCGYACFDPVYIASDDEHF